MYRLPSHFATFRCGLSPDRAFRYAACPLDRAVSHAHCATQVSPVGGDCVVELVGLESTTRVLWNMVRVRPTTLVGHPSRSSGFIVFRDYPGSWSDSNEQPDF